MIVRLNTGSFSDEGKPSEDGTHLDKDVLLVYAGKFESMDGPVEIKDDDIDKLASRHNSMLSKVKRMATGDIPMRAYPPLQMDHSTSAKDTIGRLMGDLKVGEFEVDGKKMKALYGKARFLGKENVEKAHDGRFTHVSIGTDLTDHSISELSVTPFPAAAHASLLSKGVKLATQEVEKMKAERLQKIDERTALNLKLSEQKEAADIKATLDAIAAIDKAIQEIEAKIHGQDIKLSSTGEEHMGYKSMKEKMGSYEKCKKHLMDEKKMSEEDAEKHMEAMNDDDLAKMTKEEDDRQEKMSADAAAKEKMAAEIDESKKAEMAGKKEALVKLIAGAKDTSSKVHLAARKGVITARLSKLKAEAKIMPSEIKKLDLTELAKQNDATLDAVFKSYEQREAVILTGAMGSIKAMSAQEIHNVIKGGGKVAGLNMSAEEIETRLSMPSKRKEMEETLIRLQEEMPEKPKMSAEEEAEHAEKLAGYEKFWGEHKKLMDEGKHEEAKEHLKKMMDGLKPMSSGADIGAEVTEKEMSALAEDVKKMQTTVDDIVKLVGPELGI